MSGYPPPYPPSPGSPFGFDPSTQRRFDKQQLRAQARAQKVSMRAQRDIEQQQLRSLRRASILGPLLIISVGVVLLLVRTSQLRFSSVVEWYGRWWPMLLVASGVVLLLEWGFDQRNLSEGRLYTRRGLGGGVIFLVILLALTGAACSGVHNASDLLIHGFNLNADNLGEFFGEKHESQEVVDSAFPPGTTLRVNNPHGDIIVTGRSGDDKIHVTINKQVYSGSDQSAEGKLRQLSPTMALANGVLDLTMPALNAATADLNITVPDFARTTVNADHGAVRISGLHGGVEVTANHGAVELDDITGDVSAHVNHNNESFTAHTIHGSLMVRGHAQDLNLSEITGPTLLEGEFYGDTHMDRLHGSLSFQTNRTNLSLAEAAGQIDINHSDVNIKDVQGPIELHTRSRNISFDGVTGELNVSNTNGKVEIGGSSPLGNATINNQNGEISVTLPADRGYFIQAEAKGGEIDNQVALRTRAGDGRSVVQGILGDGANKVILRTTHASIHIHQNDAPVLHHPI